MIPLLGPIFTPWLSLHVYLHVICGVSKIRDRFKNLTWHPQQGYKEQMFFQLGDAPPLVYAT